MIKCTISIKEESMNYYVTIYSILFNDNNEFLALQYRDGKWAFPGGHLENGENWNKAILREIKEETGIDKDEIFIKLPIHIDTWTYGGKNYFGSVLLGKTCIKKIELSEEHLRYKWVDKITCRELTPKYDSFFEIVEKAYDLIFSYED